MEFNILGIDPSLNNTGLAVIKVNEHGDLLSLEKLRLATTEADKTKTVRRNSDDIRRARRIIDAIDEITREFSILAAVAEVPTGTQSARGSISNGISIGVLAGLHVPLIQVLPKEVKDRSVASSTASKEDIFRWAAGLFPDADWIKHTRGRSFEAPDGRIYSPHNEHLADAVAAVKAGVASDDFKLIAKIHSARSAA